MTFNRIVVAFALIAVLTLAAPANAVDLKPITVKEGRKVARDLARHHARARNALDYSVFACRKSGRYRVICGSSYDYENDYCYAKIRVTATSSQHRAVQYGAWCDEY